jgi:hypothetical protein
MSIGKIEVKVRVKGAWKVRLYLALIVAPHVAIMSMFGASDDAIANAYDRHLEKATSMIKCEVL